MLHVRQRPFKAKALKRVNNLFNEIIGIENLQLADKKARKGKRLQYGVIAHDKNKEANIHSLHLVLKEKRYKTSAYTTFRIYEPKEREIFRLPYYPDRIVHHAIMNVLKPVFIAMFTADTYSCIEGRGIHGAARAVKKALQDVDGTKYCLKLDIKKFYPSIDHRVLKCMLRRKIKDEDLLSLLGEIVDSAPGVPIGNYLSQYFANFYLNGFDHWIKEVKKVKYYFRYADDLVFLSKEKSYLHQLLHDIRNYLQDLHLTIKDNYQVFPVDARGIDFVGYVFFHGFTRLRKTIKQNFARMVATSKNKASIDSYYSWAKHCNSRHLLKKLLMNEAV